MLHKFPHLQPDLKFNFDLDTPFAGFTFATSKFFTIMRAIQLIKYGRASEAFRIAETEKPGIESNEVLIKAATFGLNFADVMARGGLYQEAPPLPAVLGYEVVGIIEETGSGVTTWTKGQRVVAFTRFGEYAEYVTTKQRALAAIPDDMDGGLATALSTQYSTAYYAAYDMANIRKGEVVMIHAAAGGVGIALTQLAHLRGCTVIGLAGSDKKIKFLKDSGVEYAINYRSVDFSKEVPAQLGRKVDVIFDPVGGKSFKNDKKILDYGGRIVAYGASDQLNHRKGFISSMKLLFGFGFMHPVSLIVNSKGVLGVNMLKIADHKPRILQETLQKVVDLAIEGKIKPLVGKEYKAEEIAAAHEYLESRQSIGKIVLHW